MNQTKIVVSYLVLSTVAVVFIGVLVFMTPSVVNTISLSEKIVVAGAFIASCMVGISFTLHPNWVRRFTIKQSDIVKNHADTLKRNFRGHHPDCTMFNTHIVRGYKKTWCAGCLGLLVGSLVSIILMILYVAVPFQQPTMVYRILFLLGLTIIVFVYLEIIIGKRQTVVHVLLNSMFILGFFLITISVVELTGKIVYGLLSVLLCFLWLDTRVQLSQWQHIRICSSCTEWCKMYKSPINVVR